MAGWLRILGLGGLVGVLAGLAAAGLKTLLHVATDGLIGRFVDLGGAELLEPRPEVLLLPALGALVAAVVVYSLARAGPGQGTDQYVRAFHRLDGRLHLRGPLVKALGSVLVIASGGSAGPEGPIAGLGAALGSKVGRLFGQSARDRRTLLVSGCAGGVGAIFGCPLGGALFAASVLYRQPEFASRALVPAFIASVVSYSTYIGLLGPEGFILEGADELAFRSAAELPIYALLAVLCAGSSALLHTCLRGVERLSSRLRALPLAVRPALGGLATGAVACAVPQVMDAQYRFIQAALAGDVAAAVAEPGAAALLFGTVLVARCVATGFTLGSGAPGGVLGPSLFIGGAAGAFLGAGLELFGFAAGGEVLRQGLIPVGMAGVLAASMRTPLAAMVMVAEMTGSYGLIVPLMLVTMTSFLLAGRFGLVEEQVHSATESPAHAGDVLVNLLENIRVREAMETDWPDRCAPGDTLGVLIRRMREGTRPCFTVVRGSELLGLVSVSDIRALREERHAMDVIIAADIMTGQLYTLDPDETLYDAMESFRAHNVDVLPVVAPGPGRRLLGMLTRSRVLELVRAHLDELREALVREHAGLRVLDQAAQQEELLGALPHPRVGAIERVPVRGELVGRSLAELDFRRDRGEVLAVELPGGGFECPPDPHRKLGPGETLVVLAPEVPGSTGGRSAAAPGEAGAAREAPPATRRGR